MNTQEAKQVSDTIASMNEEQNLAVDFVLMKNGIDPSNQQQVATVEDNDGLTQELLDNIPGADQLSAEQRRALINQISLRDVTPAMKPGRDYYGKITGNGAQPLTPDQSEELLTLQEKTLEQFQQKGELLKSMHMVKAGFNGAIVTQDIGRAAAPNQQEMPNLNPQGPGKGPSAA